MARQSGSSVQESKKTVVNVAERSLTRDQLVEFYRLMYLSRRTDDREIVLKRQQKIFFQVRARVMRLCWWLPGWR